MPVRLNHRSAVEEGTEACGQSETLISGQSDLWPSPTQNKWTTEKQSMNQHWFTRFHKTLRPKEIDLVCPLKPAPIAQSTPQTKNIKTQPNSGSKQHDIHVDLLTTGRSLLWMGPRTSRFQFCSPGQMPYGWRSTPIKTLEALEQIWTSGWPSQNEQNYQTLQADFRAVSEEIEVIQTFHLFLSGEKG